MVCYKSFKIFSGIWSVSVSQFWLHQFLKEHPLQKIFHLKISFKQVPPGDRTGYLFFPCRVHPFQVPSVAVNSCSTVAGFWARTDSSLLLSLRVSVSSWPTVIPRSVIDWTVGSVRLCTGSMALCLRFKLKLRRDLLRWRSLRSHVSPLINVFFLIPPFSLLKSSMNFWMDSVAVSRSCDIEICSVPTVV